MIDTVVIYHGGNCLDGAAAAAAFTPAAAKYGKERGREVERFGHVRFHGTTQRDFANDRYMPPLAGKNVFIVDYSYDRATIMSIKAVARRLRIYDHHETAEAELTGVEDCVFDIHRCGAEIAWQEVIGSLPWWMQYVRDHDLWEWKVPGSREFAAAMRDNCDLMAMAGMLWIEPLALDDIFRRGREIVAAEDYGTKLICKRGTTATMHVNRSFIGQTQYRVIAVNSPVYVNEVGNKLAEDAGAGAHFAVVYHHDARHNNWKVSLRGRRDCEINLAAVARAFKGGGHYRASGFAVDDISKVLVFNTYHDMSQRDKSQCDDSHIDDPSRDKSHTDDQRPASAPTSPKMRSGTPTLPRIKSMLSPPRSGPSSPTNFTTQTSASSPKSASPKSAPASPAPASPKSASPKSAPASPASAGKASPHRPNSPTTAESPKQQPAPEHRNSILSLLSRVSKS